MTNQPNEKSIELESPSRQQLRQERQPTMATPDGSILRQKQMEILRSFGTIEFDPDFEYRSARLLDMPTDTLVS